MPDAPDKTSAPASDKHPVNPDLVGEELADNANIWHVYDRVAKEDDERRTKSWDNGLNNLALFAGLFSAVTTAFIIEARQDMEPDYAQLAFLVLNATAFGEKPSHQPFVIPSGARTVNCLWVASLILSLSAALIAVMGKDWIGMYTARPVCNLRQWAEMRTYRLLCVERWYMSGVIAAAPVLLHVSLLFFGAGLALFVSSDALTQHLTIGLSAAAGVLYLATTFSAVVFPTSPFKSPATQMIRAALSALSPTVGNILHPPKRNLAQTLLRNVNAIIIGRAEDAVSLPARAADSQPRLSRRSALAIFSAGWKIAAAHVQCMLTALKSARFCLLWPFVQARLRTIASAGGRVIFTDRFLSSTWTDPSRDRRPELLAEALSWLNGASRAPDVFRAIVFALGDLEIGPQVAQRTSLSLRTRLRAEIRRTWQDVDFLTLSRYVLADRNTPGDPVVHYVHFVRRFDPSTNPALRCEDGLAAVIIIDPVDISPHDFLRYLPDHLAQPRMPEFLLPYIQQTTRHLADVMILLAHRYRKHLCTNNAFSLEKLDVYLYPCLDDWHRDAYPLQVTNRYRTTGPIELLTFLCCSKVIGATIKPVAVELIMELLELLPAREHRCLAYIFGSSQDWYTALRAKRWSPWSLSRLAQSLPFEPGSARMLLEDQGFEFALARTAVMILCPQHHRIEHSLYFPMEQELIEFLFRQLCRSPPQRFSGQDEKPGVIQLILESAALYTIVSGRPDSFADHVVTRGTAILAKIIWHLNRRLCDPKTVRDGERLFAALACTEVHGADGQTLIWDLGQWLRERAHDIVKNCVSGTAAIQGVHDALVAIYPLRKHNYKLRRQLDRIGYVGRPGDTVWDVFLDIGEFFATAERPPSPEDIDERRYVMM